MLIIVLSVVGLILGILFLMLSFYIESYGNDTLSCIIGVPAFIAIIIAGVGCIMSLTLIGVKGDNKELFLKEQQEYNVLIQYINSNKSDSILESSDMMKRIQDYNNLVIEKQSDMTRPIKKYWVEGADWNELKLIDLSNTKEGNK